MKIPLLAAAALLATASNAAAQADVLLQLRSAVPLADRFRVDSSGAFVAYGFVRDVSSGTGCAAQIPATGAGTRFMWHPCRGAVRWGRVPNGQTDWDDASIQDFSFAGGSDVVASGINSFAFGDMINVTAQAATGFGSGVTVSGTAGFSAGASNVCSGFACTAIGYTVRAGGQGSVALGYRTTANNNYAVALGYRASNNTHTGTMVMGDESTTDSVRNQADNEFRIRYNGGIRLRVSTASNGNTPGAGGNVGCDLTVAVPSWTCASSRTLKENFVEVDGEDVLARIRTVPITTWSMIGGDRQVRHMGPVAEDFYRAFPLGLGETAIGLGDIDGVNLAAAKALEQRTTRLQTQLDERTAEVAQLRSEVAELRTQVQALVGAQAAAPRP
ncbi:MAG TPA: tail fiber domain-containing protein [Longimicrobium sp.]|nr:tail fiber domain-containing protein [Longimicrobium sp.]